MVNFTKIVILLATAVAVSAGVVQSRDGAWRCDPDMQTCATGKMGDTVHVCRTGKCTGVNPCTPNNTGNGKYEATCF
ncbi:hypothetical protein PTMSG1_06270 [Pyrenophora teres f. maculata]|nr:hypothetical protein PTMSG1_06270 [Pyrenophora teres f. maculata]